MKLEKIEIEGFRRIKNATIVFNDATFLIGENNVGKSTVFKAIEKLLTVGARCESEDYFYNGKGEQVDTIVLTAEFTELPPESLDWVGFKGRVLINVEGEKKTYSIKFRKIFKLGGEIVREMKVHPRTLNDKYTNCTTIDDFISLGINEEELTLAFGEVSKNRKLTLAQQKNLEKIDRLWDYDLKVEEWFSNPGGIEQNVNEKLPKLLLIPAEHKMGEINTNSGVLQTTMKELFEEVRNESDNYKEAQKYLDLLEKELDPDNKDKEFGKMMEEVNGIVGAVFQDTKLHVKTELNNPDSVLKPNFLIEMSSNVQTMPERQGLGSIRSAVFALLRYRESFLEKRKKKDIEKQYFRTLLICFEEPEMYLHPNASALMRDNIYKLAISSTSQIICTTHSPYMIDLTKDIELRIYPKQVLNLFRINNENDDKDTIIHALNVTEEFNKLLDDEKVMIKFVLRMDDYVAKVFFANKVLIYEGDTEEIVIRETLKRMEFFVQRKILANYQFINAHGKATIIALVKYLKALGIQPFVIHDKDLIPGAIKFNEPIKEALGGEEFRYMFENCIEDVLGYKIPDNNKPYYAFDNISKNWGMNWDGVSDRWKKIVVNNIFTECF